MTLISWNTLITDILAAVGFLILMISPIIFAGIQRKILNQRLHTRVDGEKLFEKLKYDLKLPKITGINKKLLYKDVNYALSIFSGAMEYNRRDLLWYFNEKHAKIHIANQIWKKAALHFLIWMGTVVVIAGGSYFDIFKWLFQANLLTNTSGVASIWVLLGFCVMISVLIKFLEYKNIKYVVNDEVRKINLAKKEKVWKDYKIIYWCSVAVFFLGWVFIFINMFF